MKKIASILMLIFTFVLKSASQQLPEIDYTIYQYGERDTCFLYMDVYTPSDTLSSHPCIVYIFGGGFIMGQRDDKMGKEFCNNLSKRGITAIAIDYRLGMKGVKQVGIFNTTPLQKGIDMATEDAITALKFILDNSSELKVNPKQIILFGSSAGAITALNVDYTLSNKKNEEFYLPDDFKLSGVISFSGAIFTKEGKLKYSNHPPAPTMFCHGNEDKLVPYNSLKFCKTGFYGSNYLRKLFKKNKYPYIFINFDKYGHDVASQFNSSLDEIEYFVDKYVVNSSLGCRDVIYFNTSYKKTKTSDWKPKDLYK